MVVTLTGGAAARSLNPAMDLPDVHKCIAEIRRDEMTRRDPWCRAHLAGLRRLRAK